MSDIIFKENEGSEYGEGIILDEYDGEWSLINANRGQNEVVYKKWCFPQKRGKNAGAADKAIPWKITLGKDKAQAIETLTWFLNVLKGQDIPDRDIPF